MPIGGSADESWQSLFEGFRKLRANWPTRGWSWDTKLSCVTSSFSAEYEKQAHDSVVAVLPTEWTKATIADAPTRLKEIVERAGGLRTGQFLFSGTTVGRLGPYGLWWPWRDDTTISLRIGLGNVDDMSDMAAKFREVFAVSF